MTEELAKALERARGRVMTPEEREEQQRNFAAGNLGIENPRVTREMIDEAARRIDLRDSK